MRGLPHQRPTLLQYLRRRRWLPRCALPVVLAAFLAAGLAHSLHLHKNDSAGARDAARCELCVQFARLATPPPAPALVTAATVSIAAPPEQPLLTVTLLVSRPYQARAPPLS